MATKLPEKLIDKPAFLAQNFAGYEHFTDPTRMPFNKLTFPSVNCTIPNFDVVVPDKGKTLYGQIFDENVGINGNKQKFKNLSGIEMEVRSYHSDDTNLKDVVQVGFDNNRLVFNTLVGVFTIGESVSGQTSGATGNVVSVVGTVMMLSNIIGTFVVGETIEGQTSGATAVIGLAPETLFYQITENVNPIPYGPHEFYFDEWFDTNLNPALSKRLPRLIWVNGYENPSTHAGEVYSWTGGIAIITSFVVNTSISINPATTWRSLGFTEDASGNAYIIVNGVSYQLTDPTDLSSSTIAVADTTGIAIGDMATSRIETDISPIPFDVCRQNKGYMFYGNWNNRQLYQSNGFNRSSVYTITSFQGGLLNDLVIDSSANQYTGATESVFHIVIDAVQPDINEQEFIPGGNGGLNDAIYTTAGYTVGHTANPNIYKVSIVADFTIAILTGTADFIAGSVIKGGTSGAEGVIIYRVNDVLVPAADLLAVKLLTVETFETNETLTDISSIAGTTATAEITFSNDWIKSTKNGIVFDTSTGGQGPQPISFLAPSSLTITLIDGLLIVFSNPFNHAVGDTFQLTINQNGIDSFIWQKDGGAFSASTPITAGSFQTLSDGVQIKFLNRNGHTLGDFWNITAIPAVTRAWDNFYYALPVRRPGEGYIYQLPSNFWTMDTQEESMYVNGSYGEWSVIDTILSSDLQSEKVSLTPLKQTGANKVLYPYLTGHISDKLIFVSVDKELDTIGREDFLEKPQMKNLSDPIKKDFLASSFKGGRIKFNDEKIFISSPENGITHVYDTLRGYWQPPKSFPEVGLLSVIGNDLVCHSDTRNQTFTMFTNSSGDNGLGYTVEVRTPYIAPLSVWDSVFSNMSFIEGRITGAPKLIHTVYEGVSGCGGIFNHEVFPIICLAPDRAPFGEGPFGSHPNGSDFDIPGNYFNEIYKAYSPVLQYYLISLGITCTALSHTWSLLSFGMNAMAGPSGNNALVNPENLAINNSA